MAQQVAKTFVTGPTLETRDWPANALATASVLMNPSASKDGGKQGSLPTAAAAAAGSRMQPVLTATHSKIGTINSNKQRAIASDEHANGRIYNNASLFAQGNKRYSRG